MPARAARAPLPAWGPAARPARGGCADRRRRKISARCGLRTCSGPLSMESREVARRGSAPSTLAFAAAYALDRRGCCGGARPTLTGDGLLACG
jgi:hypothetical protein